MKFKLGLLLSIITISSFAQEAASIPGLNTPPKEIKEPANLKKLRLAVEANPNNLNAHKEYLDEFRRSFDMKRTSDFSSLKNQYDQWIKRFPSSSTIPFVLGEYFYRMEKPDAKNYLLKAVEVNPDLAECWYMLAIDAMRWGDKNLESEYLKNAKNKDPKNIDYAIYYAYSFLGSNKAKSDSLLLDVALKFPTEDNAAKALSLLIRNEEDESIQNAYYSQLYKRFSTSKSPAFRDAMSGYFSLLINSNQPDKALELALDMVFVVKTNTLEWKQKIKVAKDFINFKKLMAAQKYNEAHEALNNIKLTDNFSLSFVNAAEKVLLTKAELADLLGQTQAAYDTIALKYSAQPTDKLRTLLLKYGIKLGKDTAEIDQEISKNRMAKAIPATPFTLLEYQTGQKVSLNDFKGKVVLLTFWFPGCGPCRAEFPHFENVLKKFSKDQIVYLGINGMPEQDDYVIPFMKSSGYSFKALKDNKEADLGNLTSWGYPSNYLIDQNGKIIYSKFMIGQSDERTLELMISELVYNYKL
ncbi:TlpA disulfide reductase family protein [Pedobacter foliorum]|uniref:TlpA disulfide reductase family protein n=1 Tax=Pedobacter foliorum TaxID=2739058 RepID=UPI0015667B6A|nr:TlpA disulfide reductase family protein [Pedobacter foliorum]NRF38296.1 redoxin domain-containing protein [Pedobacter foliorum]